MRGVKEAGGRFIIIVLLTLLAVSPVLAADATSPLSCAKNFFKDSGRLMPCIADYTMARPTNFLNSQFAVMSDLLLWIFTLPVNIWLVYKGWLIMGTIVEGLLAGLLIREGYLLMFASSPEQQFKARRQLKKYLMMVLILPASFLLYLMLFDITNWLTAYVWYNIVDANFLYGSDQIFTSLNNIALFIAFAGLFLFFLIKLLVRGMERVTLLLVVTFLSPLALVLWYLPETEAYGKKMFSIGIFNLLVPVIFSIIFVVVGAISSTFPPVITIFFFMAAMVICIKLYDKLVYEFDLTGHAVATANSLAARYQKTKRVARVVKKVVKLVVAA